MSGYLTQMSCQQAHRGIRCQLRVPNQEVNNLYRTIIELWLANGYGLNWYDEFIHSLVSGDTEQFKQHLQKIMLQITSFHDLATEQEAFFHGLLLGCIASLQDTYEIKSNRESCLGRYDIMLIPKDSAKLGVIIELKAKRTHETISLDSLAKTALQQIEAKHYATELKQRGIPQTLQIAIAFEGKQLALCSAIAKK
jgi:pyruvoyl-dependent arginine decarboxylase (PvlArgDC)